MYYTGKKEISHGGNFYMFLRSKIKFYYGFCTGKNIDLEINKICLPARTPSFINLK
jgi:hypothetical protein